MKYLYFLESKGEKKFAVGLKAFEDALVNFAYSFIYSHLPTNKQKKFAVSSRLDQSSSRTVGQDGRNTPGVSLVLKCSSKG